MMLAKSILGGAVLAAVNLGGIWIGFMMFKLAGSTYQPGIQLPVAFIISVLGFALWSRLVNPRISNRFRFRSRRDGYGIYLMAPAWAALIFVPTHFAVSGYLAAFTNILALWAFQLLTNLAVIEVGLKLACTNEGGNGQEKNENQAGTNEKRDQSGT